MCNSFIDRDVSDGATPMEYCTLIISNSAGAMRKSNILCKALSTVESLGAVNLIASDKTGTLTQNRMSAVNVAFGANPLTIAEARHMAGSHAPGSKCVKALAAVAALCNDAEFDNTDGEELSEKRKINGDATGSSFNRVPLFTL